MGGVDGGLTRIVPLAPPPPRRAGSRIFRSFAVVGFQARLADHEHRRDGQVPDGRDDEEWNGQKRLRAVIGRHLRQLEGEGNRGHERRRLEHRDRLVAGWGNDDPHRLGNDDPVKDLPRIHAQSLCRLLLAFIDRVQPRTHDFGKIRAFVQPQADDCRHGCREQVVGAEAEEFRSEGHAQAQAGIENADQPPEDQLRVDRRSAEEPNVEGGYRPHDGIVRAPHDCHENRQGDAYGHRRDRQDERPSDRPEDLHREECLPDHIPVEILVRREAVDDHCSQKSKKRRRCPSAVVGDGNRTNELRFLPGVFRWIASVRTHVTPPD